jgi:hypothetical protein
VNILIISLVPSIIVALSGFYFKDQKNIFIFSIIIAVLVVFIGDITYALMDAAAVFIGYKVAIKFNRNSFFEKNKNVYSPSEHTPNEEVVVKSNKKPISENSAPTTIEKSTANSLNDTVATNLALADVSHETLRNYSGDMIYICNHCNEKTIQPDSHIGLCKKCGRIDFIL